MHPTPFVWVINGTIHFIAVEDMCNLDDRIVSNRIATNATAIRGDVGDTDTDCDDEDDDEYLKDECQDEEDDWTDQNDGDANGKGDFCCTRTSFSEQCLYLTKL